MHKIRISLTTILHYEGVSSQQKPAIFQLFPFFCRFGKILGLNFILLVLISHKFENDSENETNCVTSATSPQKSKCIFSRRGLCDQIC